MEQSAHPGAGRVVLGTARRSDGVWSELESLAGARTFGAIPAGPDRHSDCEAESRLASAAV